MWRRCPGALVGKLDGRGKSSPRRSTYQVRKLLSVRCGIKQYAGLSTDNGSVATIRGHPMRAQTSNTRTRHTSRKQTSLTEWVWSLEREEGVLRSDHYAFVAVDMTVAHICLVPNFSANANVYLHY